MTLAFRASSSRLPMVLPAATRTSIPVRLISTSPIARAKLPLQATSEFDLLSYGAIQPLPMVPSLGAPFHV